MQAARDPVVVAAVRTPIGRGHPEKGVFRGTHANDLLGRCLVEVVDRAGVAPADVEDVIVGCVTQYGEQALNVGRNAWLQAGLPVETPATTLDRQCGSGQQAVNFAAAQIASGVHDVVLAAGVEHMGHLPLGTNLRWADEIGTAWPEPLLRRYDLVPQGISAEMIAERWEIGRDELDAFSLRSHRRAAGATEDGRLADEIVPVEVELDGERTLVERDQGIRSDTSLEALAQLRPAFREDGRITAGNSSQISDGAAAVLLMSRDEAQARGVAPLARVVDQTTVGVDPVLMLTGPIPATRILLERNGLEIEDVERFEVNEAFASVVLAWERELGADPERVNVNGGAVALGHPLGASGARLIATMAHELRRSGARLGLVAMCCGGGLGTGTLLERE
jgi:acetyl-CoA acetyltransferase family protein